MRLTFCASLVAIAAATSSGALAAKPKIPEQTKISTYDASEFRPEDGGVIGGDSPAFGPASGPKTQFTEADLARLNIISSAYPSLTKFLEDLIKPVIDAGPAPHIRPNVRIFNSQSQEARAINPDLILVSTGLLTAIRDMYRTEGSSRPNDAPPPPGREQDAISFFLVHEYAHILYGHPRRYRERHDATLVSKPLLQGYAGMTFAQSVSTSYGQAAPADFGKAQKGYMAAIVASPWIEAELYRASYAPFQKEEEQTADYLAVDLLLRPATPLADAAKGAAPIENFYPSYDDSLKAKLKSLSKDVGETLTTAATSIVASAPAQLIADPSGFGAMAKGQLIYFGAARVIGWLKNRVDKNKVHLYYSGDDRLKAINGYADLYYKEKLSAPETLAAFGAPSKSKQFIAAFDQEHTPTAAAEQAAAFLAKGDVEGAKKALESVKCKAPCRNIPYLMAAGDAAFAEGQISTAIVKYQQARNLKEAPPQAYASLARAQLRAGLSEDAIMTIEAGVKKFGAPTFIVQKIEAFASLQRKEEALAALEECKALGRKDLTETCEAAAAPVLPPKEGPKLLDSLPLGIPKL